MLINGQLTDGSKTWTHDRVLLHWHMEEPTSLVTAIFRALEEPGGDGGLACSNASTLLKMTVPITLIFVVADQVLPIRDHHYVNLHLPRVSPHVADLLLCSTGIGDVLFRECALLLCRDELPVQTDVTGTLITTYSNEDRQSQCGTSGESCILPPQVSANSSKP